MSVSEEKAAVVKYLADKNIQHSIDNAINHLVKAKPEDAFGFLARELSKLAKPAAIAKLVGREVLDSRGNPTVEADVYATVYGETKFLARESAPSGASTGSNEALELRDGDEKRYLKKGVLKAAGNVSKQLSEAVHGIHVTDLKRADEAMIKADGTRLKKNLGGNALTAASFAIAQAGAALNNRNLFEHLAEVFYGGHDKVPKSFHLPRPMVNILNGGKHAGGNLKIQEFMIVPKAGNHFRENLRYVTEVYHHLAKILVAKFGVSAKNLGDEGGYAPSLEDPDEALTLIEQAIKAAGYVVGQDVFLALDAASSEFYDDGKYEVQTKMFLTSEELVQYWLDLKKKHPALISIEDGLAEQDYEGWIKLTARFSEEAKDVMLVGDDLYTTNTDLIKQGVDKKWATALLLKVNQIGTISEAMDAARMIFEAKQNVAVSHRSGESAGNVISDLCVAIGAQFIKTGATARGERISKYNRLLEIEDYLEEHHMLKV